MSDGKNVVTGSVGVSNFKHNAAGGVEKRISWGMILVALLPVVLTVLAVWFDSLNGL